MTGKGSLTKLFPGPHIRPVARANHSLAIRPLFNQLFRFSHHRQRLRLNHDRTRFSDRVISVRTKMLMFAPGLAGATLTLCPPPRSAQRDWRFR